MKTIFIAYFQLISLNSQQNLATQSYSLLDGYSVKRPLGPLYIRAHLELSPLGLEVGLNFSPTLQSGP